MDQVIKPDMMARLLRISKINLYKLCKEGKLPHAKIGGSLRFSSKHYKDIITGRYSDV